MENKVVRRVALIKLYSSVSGHSLQKPDKLTGGFTRWKGWALLARATRLVLPGIEGDF